MRAFLSVRDELSLADSHEQARLTRTWIIEKFRAPHGEFIHAGNVLKRRLAASPTQSAQEHNPRLANHKGEACDHHELGEIAARPIIVLRRVNRELLPPVRLLPMGLIIRRDDFRTFRFHFPSPQGWYRRATGCLRVDCRWSAHRARRPRRDALPSNAPAPSC